MSRLKINKKEAVSIESNLVFLIPFFIAIYQGKLIFSIIIATVFLASTTYHTFKKPGADWWWKDPNRTLVQSLLLYSDTFFALILGLFILQAFTSSGLGIGFWISVLIAIPAVILFMNTNSKHYVSYHSMWHVLTALIVTIALLS